MKTEATAKDVELGKKRGKTEGDGNCKNKRKAWQAEERREYCGAGAVLKNLNKKFKLTHII